jgi:hypothetical protein
VYPLRDLALPAGFDTPVYLWSARVAAAAGLGSPALQPRPATYGLLAVLFTGPGSDGTAVAAAIPALVVVAGLAAAALAAAVFGSRPSAVAVTALVVSLSLTRLGLGYLSTALFLGLFVAAVAVLIAGLGGGRASAGVAAGLAAAAALAHPRLALIVPAIGACVVPTLVLWRRHVPGWAEAAIRVGVVIGVASIAIGLTLALAPSAPMDTSVDAGLQRLGLAHALLPIRRSQLVGLLPGFLAWALAAVLVVDRLIRRREPDDVPSAPLVFWGTAVGWVVVTGAAGLALLSGVSIPAHRLLWICVPLPLVVGVAAGMLFRGGPSRSRWTTLASVAAPVAVLAIVALAHALPWRTARPTLTPERAAELTRAAETLDQPGAAGVVLMAGRSPLPVLFDRLNWLRAIVPADDVDAVAAFPGTAAELAGGGPGPTHNAAVDRVTSDLADGARAEVADGSTSFEEADEPTAGPIAPDVTVDPWLVVVIAPLLVLGFAAIGLGWTRWALPGAPAQVGVGVTPALGLGALALAAVAVDLAGIRLSGVGAVLALALAAVPGWVLWLVVASRREGAQTTETVRRGD